MVPSEKAGEIVYLSVDELVIDPCNVRAGVWDYDEEFIQSVKQHGIRLPLLVRPLKDKLKYGIVCGSRRYHAALEADLKKVPCIVQAMDDIEAMGASLEENVIRRDIPLWQVIDSVGKMYEMLKKLRWEKRAQIDYWKKLKTIEDRYKEISKRTSLKKDKVSDYVRISLYLPAEVKALLKPKKDRTQYEEERLRKILYRTESPLETLNVYKAKLILEELADFPLEKQVEVAAYILTKTNDKALKVVKAVKENPKAPMWEIEQIIRGKAPDLYVRSISLDKETLKALENACVRKQKKLPDLVLEIIKDWLRRNLYLAREET
jgi:hypothetical protein